MSQKPLLHPVSETVPALGDAFLTFDISKGQVFSWSFARAVEHIELAAWFQPADDGAFDTLAKDWKNAIECVRSLSIPIAEAIMVVDVA